MTDTIVQLPVVSDRFLERSFALRDSNVEVTSLDIAPHGAFVVAGTSSGMVLLFDLTNPSDQNDGLLIGQIRARGMHTNLILTVKFSEDGRFVFAGVSKGSSEMLAIDLGRILVDWESEASASSRTTSEAVQQSQLQNLLTFSFSDAKLRGFGAVTRLDHTAHRATPSGSSAFRISARYRLACGRGIKNVHIWHFTAGYLAADDDVPIKDRLMHGKWEYVCDIATNGNTVTHIEFRAGGAELLSKSAGMSIRVWELNATEVQQKQHAQLCLTDEGTTKKDDSVDAAGTEAEAACASQSVAPVTGPSGFTLRPTYVDVANSQDIKCLLPVGSVAYGGTYQFAVLNTGAPKEANRDVLELPERYSGDGVGSQLPGNAPVSAGRGRRITREIEQVVCSEAGQHALVMCADGGVVFYGAAVPDTAAADDAENGEPNASGLRGVLLELPGLFRIKDQQQHPGSWALRRVGRHGTPVLLRAVADTLSDGVIVEARLLAGVLPGSAHRYLADPPAGGLKRSGSYYVDDTFHAEQVEARKAWRKPATAGPAAGPAAGSSTGSALAGIRSVKKPKRLEDSVAEKDEKQIAPPSSVPRKRKTPAAFTEVSPAGIADLMASGAMVTPGVTQASAARHNRTSPYEDATARLAGASGDNSGRYASSPLVHPAAPSVARSAGRSRGGLSASSSSAKLRAWRDDDDDDVEREGEGRAGQVTKAFAVRGYAPMLVGPAPKVRRLQVSTAVHPLAHGARTADTTPAAWTTVKSVMQDWLQRCPGNDPVYTAGHGVPPLGACSSQRLAVIATEQDRLRDLFLRDLTTLLVAKAEHAAAGNRPVEGLVAAYSQLASEMALRQQLELQGACAADAIMSQQALPSHAGLAAVKVQCRFAELLKSATALEARVVASLRSK